MLEHKEREVAFFGKITAGITHEMKNVLAIIKESSGLMEDILAVTEEDAFPNKAKFQKTLERILRQVQRGVDITTHLNRFAHGPDHSPVSVDLNEVSEQMVLLASRFARLKNVVLETSSKNWPLLIKTHPVALQMALFISIEVFLDRITSGGKITISPKKMQNKHVISLRGEDSMPADTGLPQTISASGQWTLLQETMAYLGGTAQVNESTSEILLYLSETIDQQNSA